MRSRLLGPFFSLLFALSVFYFLYGWDVLNPHFYSWLTQGDPSQHFYGFNFFNQEHWSFPPGRVQGFDWPGGTSLVYTDSLPWLSLPLKLLFQGQIFQFHGIWILLCFLLQGLSAYYFLFQACENECDATLGSFLLTLFPSFLFRAFNPSRHYSCLAHFLIFPALSLVFTSILGSNHARSPPVRLKTRPLWIALLALSLGIHFYFFFINFILWLVLETPYFQKNWRLEKWNLAKIGAGCVLLMWIFVYFVIPVTRSLDGGFGTYSMNLVSWINSEGYSILGISLPEVTSEQREGYQYLGLGIIFLSAACLSAKSEREKLKLIWKRVANSRFELLVWFLVFLALSVRLSFFQYALYDWVTAPLYLIIVYGAFRRLKIQPKKALLFTVFFLIALLLTGRLLRSSGRVGWYLSYTLVFLLFYLKPKRTILVSALMLQLMDVAPMIRSIRDENMTILADHTAENSEQDFESKGLPTFLANTDKISLVELTPSEQSPVALFALHHHLALGPVYVARGHLKQEARDFIKQSKENLLAATISNDIAYVTVDPQLIENLMKKDNLAMLRTGAYLWIKRSARN